MDLIRLRDVLAESLGIGKLACAVGHHAWTSDDPPNRPVYIHRRHCVRCAARQRAGHIAGPWVDVAPKQVWPKKDENP